MSIDVVTSTKSLDFFITLEEYKVPKRLKVQYSLQMELSIICFEQLNGNITFHCTKP